MKFLALITLVSSNLIELLERKKKVATKLQDRDDTKEEKKPEGCIANNHQGEFIFTKGLKDYQLHTVPKAKTLLKLMFSNITVDLKDYCKKAKFLTKVYLRFNGDDSIQIKEPTSNENCVLKFEDIKSYSSSPLLMLRFSVLANPASNDLLAYLKTYTGQYYSKDAAIEEMPEKGVDFNCFNSFETPNGDKAGFITYNLRYIPSDQFSGAVNILKDSVLFLSMMKQSGASQSMLKDVFGELSYIIQLFSENKVYLLLEMSEEEFKPYKEKIQKGLTGKKNYFAVKDQDYVDGNVSFNNLLKFINQVVKVIKTTGLLERKPEGIAIIEMDVLDPNVADPDGLDDIPLYGAEAESRADEL